MSVKRSLSDLDPEYEDVSDQQQKRQRLFEDGAKESTVRRIERIIHKHFNLEIHKKEEEIDVIDQRLSDARHLLDRLRACIVANYYGKAGQIKVGPNQPPVIHPAVKKLIRKSLPKEAMPSGDENPQQNNTSDDPSVGGREALNGQLTKQETPRLKTAPAVNSSDSQVSSRSGNEVSLRSKVKKRVVVGNVSKYIPVDRRDDNDLATHKWMVYVRGPRDSPRIDDFVEKVWFFLHPSYRPNDLVEISQPPFHLTRRGWGEFPIRVQLHFTDSRNKRADIIHHLKLDKTYTGIQTLGSETHVDVELDRGTLPLDPTLSLRVPEVTSSQDVSFNTSDVDSLSVTQPAFRGFVNSNDASVSFSSFGSLTPTASNSLRSESPSTALSGSSVVPSTSSQHDDEVTKATASLLSMVTDTIKPDPDAENSLGVVWAQDMEHTSSAWPGESDEFLDASYGGILGNGDVLLSSGALKDFPGFRGNQGPQLPLPPTTTSTTTAPLTTPSPTPTTPQTPGDVSPRQPHSSRSRTPSKLQISRSLTPQGWTRLQIKQEDEAGGDKKATGTKEAQVSSVGDVEHSQHALSVTSSPSVAGGASAGNVSMVMTQAGTAPPGWSQVQLNSEPKTPEKSLSSVRSSVTPERPSVTSDPLSPVTSTPVCQTPPPGTPERVVRLEIGHSVSPGIKINVADRKKMLHLSSGGADSGDGRHGDGNPTDGRRGDSAGRGKAKGNSTKQLITLGSGVGQLRSSGTSQGAKSGAVQTLTPNSSSKLAVTTVSQAMTQAGGVPMTTGSTSLKTILTQPPPTHPVTPPDTVTSQKSSVAKSSVTPPQDNVYVQCLDASGNVFLIPQQMLKSSTTTPVTGGQGQGQGSHVLKQVKVTEDSIKKKLSVHSEAKVAAVSSSKLSTEADNSSEGQKKAADEQSVGSDDSVAQTTIVGSGPNKATLTYVMSHAVGGVTLSSTVNTAQASLPVTSKVSTVQRSSHGPEAAKGVVGLPIPLPRGTRPAGVPSQRLVWIPGPTSSATNLRPLTLMATRKTPPGKVAMGASRAPPQVLIKDQAGNIQILQTVKTSEALTPTGTKAASTQRSISSKPGVTPPPAGLVAVQTLVAPPGTQTVVAKGDKLAKSPVRSVLIPKESFDQLHSSQLIHLQAGNDLPQGQKIVPQGQKLIGQGQKIILQGQGSSKLLAGSAASQLMVIASNAQQQGSATIMAGPRQQLSNTPSTKVTMTTVTTPSIGLTPNKSQSPNAVAMAMGSKTPTGVTPVVAMVTGPKQPVSGVVAKGSTVGVRSQGSISLLRPGLIFGKLPVCEGVIEESQASAARPDETPKRPDADKSEEVVKEILTEQEMEVDAPTLKETAAETQSGQSQPTGNISKVSADSHPTVTNTKSGEASTGGVVQALKAGAESSTKPTAATSQPLYLTTKIGNQTVLLKIEQSPASLGSTKGQVVTPRSVAGPSGVSLAENSSLSRHLSTVAKVKDEPMPHGIAKTTSAIATIKHGSILGIGKQRESVKVEVDIDINLGNYASVERLISRLVRHFPLVSSDVDRSVHPYCARSREAYLAWNVGKRRACEWQRASRIRRKILSLLKDEFFHEERVWTTREIVTWCREHCYTPLDKEISCRLSPVLSPSTRGRQRCFSSYSDHQEALERLSLLPTHSPGVSSEDEDIDVESLGVAEETAAEANSPPKGHPALPTDVLPPSALAQYVRDVGSQIGVSYEPTTLSVGQSRVMVSLAEEAIVAGLKLFLDDLLRESAANLYRSKINPQELRVDDIYNTLKVSPRCDFLANTHMGAAVLRRTETN